MPDIFLSYSSKDRAVADRVQARLAEQGYDVFWDQNTPPGIDWDSWIREQLKTSRCVLVLWSKESVTSPNVRHEAIIGRERSRLLPIMVDDLEPTDFPMGLFHVQALKVGRTAKSLSAVWPKLLDEVKAKLDAHPPAEDPGADEKAKRQPRPKAERPLWRRPAAIGGALLALLLIVGVWQWRPLTILFDASQPPVPAESVAAARDGERLARERVVRSAEQTISSNRQAVGSSWVWLAAQLMSSTPEQARGISADFFRYLTRVQKPECDCFFAEEVPHAVGNAWVVIAHARYRQPISPLLLRTILASQNPEGWWSISLSATPNPSNAAMHATAMLTIALVEARDAGIIPEDLRGAANAAIGRSVTWLSRGPEDGASWLDYPNNERRVENIVFAAMAAVASRLGGEPNGRAAQAFRRAAAELPGATDTITSSSYAELPNGTDFIDQYRHPLAPWIGAAAVLTYRDGTIGERRALRRIIRDWLATDIGDERLLRQDWMTGETLFLRALAFPVLEGDQG